MSQVAPRVVYADGKWNGNTLAEWVPDAVKDIVEGFDPVKVILFGSVARGEEDPDSDLDLLVILDHLDKAERHKLMSAIHSAIDAPAPIDIFVTDEAEFEARKDVNGSMHYWPSREGRVVSERTA